MSLTDALLLDGYREAKEVWITLRRDGQKGSGTQADPYDGSTLYSTAISITSLTNPDINKPLEAVAVTSSPHGFGENDVVVISGTGASGDWWDGTFLIYGVSTNSFKYLMRIKPMSSSPTGRVVQKPLSYRFDERLGELPANATLHIAPGSYETQGVRIGTSPAWRLKSGQRILGAGMGLTTIKITRAIEANKHSALVATEYLDGLQVSDLTVDCNVDGQPLADVECGAIVIVLGGTHIRVRRVRAINFGSRVPSTYTENFVFFFVSTLVTTRDPITYAVQRTLWDLTDCVVEDCVAERPSPNNYWNSSIFLVGGNGEDQDWGAVRANNRACVIRNCYVDARNDYGPVTQIQSISWAGGVATVVTKTAHGHKRPGNLIVRGVVDNTYNGIFEIASVTSDTQLTYALATTPSQTSLGAGGTIGGRVSGTSIAIEKIEAGSTSKRFKLTAKEPHFRTTNNNITIAGVSTAGAKALNGTFPITVYDPSKPNELEFDITGEAIAPATTYNVFAKVGPHALTADNGIAEGNRVFHCASSGPYHDTFSARDIVARENYFQDIVAGPTQFFTGVSTWNRGVALKSLEYDDSEWVCPTLALHSFAIYDNSIVTAKLFPSISPLQDPAVVTRHGLLPQEPVNIRAASADANVYEGTFKVVETPDAATFTYEANGTATLNANAGEFLPLIPSSYDPANTLYRLRPLQAMSKQGTGPYTITATVAPLWKGDKNHGLEVGEIVKIGNAGFFPSGGSPSHSPYLNGNFKVTAIDTVNGTFQFQINNNPGDLTASDFCAGYYGRIWRWDYGLIENNVIELAVRPLWADFLYTSDAGLTPAAGGHAPQYPIRQTVIRDNLFRSVNNGSDPNKSIPNYPLARAIRFGVVGGYGPEDALVQRNIIRLDTVANVSAVVRPSPIEFQPQADLQRGVRTFNNTSADGILIPAIMDPQFAYEQRPELVSIIRQNIDDALAAAFLVSL